MNDYGLLWLPGRLIYTFNGNAVCTIETTYPNSVATDNIRFLTALAEFKDDPFGAPADPAGAEMDVAWVRVSEIEKR
jgi:hypothetical protein